MKTTKLQIISVLAGFVLLLSACSKDAFFNFFVGGQPNFIGDHTYVPGLNILGIIRPDSIGSIPMSFVHMEHVIAAVSEQSDTFLIRKGRVVVYKMDKGVTIDSTYFLYSNPNSLFSLNEYRPVKFHPKAGEHYRIWCSAENLPELTAETTVPAIPQIEGDTVFVSANKLQLSIVSDSSAALYDVYLTLGSSTYSERIVKEKNKNTPVELKFNETVLTGAKLLIYAYDQKLAEYFAAANLSFKPNTYRPPFTNVQNGYGCFGSMNLLERNF